MDNLLLDYLPILATVLLTFCYVPQIVRTFQTKDVSGMSLAFWIMLNLSLACLLINATVIFIKFGTWGYMVTEILNLGLAFVMLTLVLKYRKNHGTFKSVNK